MTLFILIFISKPPHEEGLMMDFAVKPKFVEINKGIIGILIIIGKTLNSFMGTK